MGRTKKSLVVDTQVDGTNTTDVQVVDSTDVIKLKIRALVSGFYDVQKLRIQTGNRVVASFNKSMGQEPGMAQKDMDKETTKLIEKLRNEYKLITDAYIDKEFAVDANGQIIKNKGKSKISKSSDIKDNVETSTTIIKVGKNDSIQKIINQMTADDKYGIHNIVSMTEYNLMRTYMMLCESEEFHEKVIADIVKTHPTWDGFFKNVKGCGPIMAANCIAYFDIAKARHVSSFWRYAGLDTVSYEVTEKDENGNTVTKTVTEAVGKKHASMGLRKSEYLNKETGKMELKNSLGYNPELRSRLLGVLGDCILKAGMRSEKDENGNKIRSYALPGAKYVEIYLGYKNRLNQKETTKDWSDAHKHRAAVRYMIQQFLRDLWVFWREYEGYEVSEPYEVAKLGNKPHKYNEAHEEAALRTKRA